MLDTLIPKMAARNCLRMWRYSLWALVTLATGLNSLLLFRGFVLGANALYTETYRQRVMLGDVLIEANDRLMTSGWKAMLDEDVQEKVDALLDQHATKIEDRLKALEVDGEISLGQKSGAFIGLAQERQAGERFRGERWNWNTLAGSPLAQEGDLVLGRYLAILLGCEPSSAAYLNPIRKGPAYFRSVRQFSCPESQDGRVMLAVATEHGQRNLSMMTLRGLIDAGFQDIDRMWGNLDLKDAQTLLDTKRVSWISVLLKPGVSSTEFASALGPELQLLNLKATPWDEHRLTDLYQRTRDFLTLLDIFMTLILCGIICLSIFNLNLKIIDERTREIGLLQSLGFSKRSLSLMFLSESSLTSFAGIGLGLILAVTCMVVLNSLGITYRAGLLTDPVPLFIDWNPSLWIKSVALLSGLALASTSAATTLALRRSVVECLVH